MIDYREILRRIYIPDIGSIWSAPNHIWNNSFAVGKPEDECHPAIVERNNPCNTISNIVPGTRKDYMKGSCVYKIKLNPNSDITHFLLKLSMPYMNAEILNLRRGWDGVQELNQKQLQEFKLQIKFCKGIDV